MDDILTLQEKLSIRELLVLSGRFSSETSRQAFIIEIGGDLHAAGTPELIRVPNERDAALLYVNNLCQTGDILQLTNLVLAIRKELKGPKKDAQVAELSTLLEKFSFVSPDTEGDFATDDNSQTSIEAAFQNQEWEKAFSLISAQLETSPSLADVSVALHLMRVIAAVYSNHIDEVVDSANFIEQNANNEQKAEYYFVRANYALAHGSKNNAGFFARKCIELDSGSKYAKQAKAILNKLGFK